MLKADALIRFLYKEDPATLSDEKWAQLAAEGLYLIDLIKKGIQNLFTNQI